MTEQALTIKEVINTTKLSKASIYRLEAAGKFPRKRKFGEKAVRWLSSEVDQWIKEREVA